MCVAHTHRATIRCVCEQLEEVWRNLTLHIINYKLFTPVISVWVPANDTLTIGFV
jgi:hypothetical protein